jgi:hypothetical protein
LVTTLTDTGSTQNADDFIDSIPAEAAIVDNSGVIIAINERWHKHANDYGHESEIELGLGSDLFEVWQRRGVLVSGEAVRIKARFHGILAGEISEFSEVFATPTDASENVYRLVAARQQGGDGAVVFLFQVTPNSLHDEAEKINHDGPQAAGENRQNSEQAVEQKSRVDEEELLRTLSPVYQTLIWDSVSNSTSANDPTMDHRAEVIGKQLANARVEAAFVLRLHIHALRILQSQIDAVRFKRLSIESRIILISILGFLINIYRHQSENRNEPRGSDAGGSDRKPKPPGERAFG